MKTLYLRIWLTVVAALALFALVSGWLVQRHLENERLVFEERVAERMSDWAQLIQNALPEATAPKDVQAVALAEWSQRLRLPLALADSSGQRIGASDSFLRREAQAQSEGLSPRGITTMRLDDGRVLQLLRPSLDRLRRETGVNPGIARGPNGGHGPGGQGGPDGERGRGLQADGDGPPMEFGPPDGGPRGGPDGPPPWQRGPLNDLPKVPLLVGLVSLLFMAVAAGAWPVVRGLTRRLEGLRRGVEVFGQGQLDHRVAVQGRDEVAAVAASFNQAAERIQALVQANQRLLANASHELRSPLARLKMAVAMLDDAPPKMRESLTSEIHTNIGELDALVEEVLLSSRLEAGAPMALDERVDLVAVAAEEAARVHASVQAEPVWVLGSERLLRRALRNLLENARRYAGEDVTLTIDGDDGGLHLTVCDRGPGVPEAQREKIFEPFYRLPGHAEREGGVGLGLSLVRQIAVAHGGSVRCEPRSGGGSCFVISLPASRRA